MMLQERLQMTEAEINVRNAMNAEADLANAKNDLNEIHNGLMAMKSWQSAPWFGTYIKGLEQGERSGSSAIDGLYDIASVAAEVQRSMRAPYKTLPQEEKERIGEQIISSLPKLRLAREKIAIAIDGWNRIPQDELVPSMRATVTPFVDQLTSANKTLSELLDTLDEAGTMERKKQAIQIWLSRS